MAADASRLEFSILSPAEIAAAYAIGASAVAVALVVVLHFLEPEFAPSWRMLSEYSLGRYGLLMRLAFLAAGTAVVALAYALSSLTGAIAVWLLAVTAIGLLGAVFVDTDPITTPRAQFTTRSNVHAALGSIFILGLPLAATIAGLAVAGDPVIGPILAVASVVPWAGLVWFMAATLRAPRRADGSGGPEVRIGWPNRFSCLAYMGWVALAASTVLI
jgi:hypothetical protein